jgi:hypothetical protein
MDEQQQHEQQQQPGGEDPNATANAAATENAGGAAPTVDPNQRQLTDEEIAKQKQVNDAAASDPNKHTGVLGRLTHELERDTGVEAWQRHQRRQKAFNDAKAGPVGAAIDDINAFLHAMDECDAETPEDMLADTDVQQAAVRARNGLKVFTGETAVTFSKPTSDAHLNIGSGGAVTGNTLANRERAAAVREQHGDPVAKPAEEEEDEDAVTVGAGTKVPQPDAHVR